MIVWGGTVDINGTNLKTNSGVRYDPVADTWSATPTQGAPTARNLQPGQAVWTGSEMIVWGGFAVGLSDTGARFNPATNVWSPISSVGRPAGRADHQVAWTGAEMIIWGGFNPLNGAKYRPSTDTWHPMSSTGAPPNRHDVRAIWTGEEMIVWGGRDDPPAGSSRRIQLGGRYNNATDTWIPTSVNHPPKRREQHTATWTGSEMVIWGGSAFGGTVGYGEGRYHAATDTWLPASSPGSSGRRTRAVSVWTGTHVMVWGGVNSSGTRQKDGVLYSPATDSWAATSITGAPAEREDHTMVWTGQEVVVWGGTLLGGARTDTGGRYVPFTDSWSPTSMVSAPAARQGHTAIWTGTEVLVWGGRGNGANGGFTNTGSRYLPTTDTWLALTTAGAPAPRELHTAIWTGTDMIVWGGLADGGTRLNSGGRFNAAVGSWSATSLVDAPEPRQEHAAVWTGEEMIVWGGWRSEGVGIFPGTGGRYSPLTNSWMPTASVNAPAGRRFHTAVWTGESMVIWGGEDIDGDTSDEFAAYYPTQSKQGTQTQMTAVSPSPSNVDEPVTITVLVTAIASAPTNGSVNIIASTGESCADASPMPIWVNSSTYSCVISFASAGDRNLTANFFGSATHKDSAAPSVTHSVIVQDELFANGFEN
jgi:N-acetylneuraminic acid mutarotase